MFLIFVFLFKFLVSDDTGKGFAVEQVARTVAGGTELHEPVRTVLAVQGERSPHQGGGGDDPETDAEPLVDARHVEDNEQDEQREQSRREDEKVLRLEPLELDRRPDPLVD